MSQPDSSAPTLHFFCGKAGAGKTTTSITLAQPHRAILLSEDIRMLRLYGDQMEALEDCVRLSQRLRTAVGPLVVDLLAAGNNVVKDFQANTPYLRSWFRSVFETAQPHMFCTGYRPPIRSTCSASPCANWRGPKACMA